MIIKPLSTPIHPSILLGHPDLDSSLLPLHPNLDLSLLPLHPNLYPSIHFLHPNLYPSILLLHPNLYYSILLLHPNLYYSILLLHPNLYPSILLLHPHLYPSILPLLLLPLSFLRHFILFRLICFSSIIKTIFGFPIRGNSRVLSNKMMLFTIFHVNVTFLFKISISKIAIRCSNCNLSVFYAIL